MIKLEHVVLASPEQMEFIIEGMRNPMNSWEKSDTRYDCCGVDCDDCKYFEDGDEECPTIFLGENDHSLMQRLSNAGTDHRKFMRMMPVYVRITAPLYWWKEFDTYRTGVTPNPMDIEMNSCSTMHKIHEKEFTLEDFSCEYLLCGGVLDLKETICILNKARELYLQTKDKRFWWQMIQLLPSSYNQTRNVMLNYEVLANIYKSRKNHKLDCWRDFCAWIKTLPYQELITGEIYD